MLQVKDHLTQSGLEQIRQIKRVAGMNKGRPPPVPPFHERGGVV